MEVAGEEGDFSVDVRLNPRYVDLDKCIACNACAEKCPKKVSNTYDGGLTKRKAIYVKYAQAVPLKYVIDSENCLKLTKGKCGNCEKICPTGAINYDDPKKDIVLKVGAIVIADGSETFDPGTHDTYGYRENPNVLTSLEFERILSASGPYGGHLVRPSDKKEPKKIAWIQCVGSRDEHLAARGYCSAVCCTYAVKEAMLAKEHSNGDLDAAIFYIDIRTNGKDFEHYYNRARDELGVRFIKSRVTNVVPEHGTGRSLISYVDETGLKVEEAFDIITLSVGLGVTREGVELAEKLGVELDHYSFEKASSFSPTQSSRPGIYVCGASLAPKDIPSSVVDASAVAGVVGSKLATARWTLTKSIETSEETDVKGEAVRIGVFVCCCGTNIAGIVDVPSVVEYAKGLPGVAYAEENLFSCSQDTQEQISEAIKQHQLNRVVVAACTPKTHESLFQETLTNAGLNKYLFEMVNIRNQCSWVHKDDSESATIKSKDLVRMAVAKAGLLEPLAEPLLEVNQSALVIGGGVAGMEAAKSLASQGYQTYLVEKEKRLGGNAISLHQTWRGEDIQAYLKTLNDEVMKSKNIQVFLGSKVTEAEGFVGQFRTMIRQGRESRILEHGVTIFATGVSEFQPEQYAFAESPQVITGLELQRRFVNSNKSLKEIKTAVFLQCFGSRIPERPYCSKLCCTQSIKSALQLKKLNPDSRVFIVYRSMRPYGLREDLYREARASGVMFIRYDVGKGFDVSSDKGSLNVSFTDRVLRRRMEINPDLLVLASAIVSEKVNPLARLYKVSQNDDGFFSEAHVKLRPVDFSTDGIFVCGMAHSPKPLDESITQALAAAARAVTLLAAKTIPMSGTVAQVDPNYCTGCLVCTSVCPYSAPKFNEKENKTEIQSTLCKGCGLCVASCRSGAIRLKGFESSQILAMIQDAI